MKAVLLICAALPVLGQPTAPQDAHAQNQPQYFDEPDFIVSGVADPSLRGGHGSDPGSRSAESLAKATAELRNGNSPADADEKQGKSLEAARAYQQAAERDPSEPNLFAWGAELITHRAADQAVEVFAKAHRLFPRSTRVLLGLAVALYSRGDYKQAAARFFAAADLDPNDPTPYLFLGRISTGAITESDAYASRLERFARLHPDNAWANYYYAANLWKRWKGADDPATLGQVQALLEKAVSVDSQLGPAFLQLGMVFAAQKNLPKAITAYRNAVAAEPTMEEAHYRLALAYRNAGQPEKAREEIQTYQRLSQQSEEARARERSEIQQFVFQLRDQK